MKDSLKMVMLNALEGGGEEGGEGGREGNRSLGTLNVNCAWREMTTSRVTEEQSARVCVCIRECIWTRDAG